jgi:hypothetical protein
MPGRVMTKNVYNFRKDKDAKGTYYWIVDPSGKLLAYVDTLDMAIKLVEHLNRK